MQSLNFGRIENLHVRCGEPVFMPPPRIVQDIKFGAESGPRPELGTPDFQLRRQVNELFDHLARLNDGMVDLLEVKHGLPFKLELRQQFAR
jgi:hypothetical protein